jgi:hypothetical protein
VCGAELEPDQTYCLECGSPTPLAPRLRRGGRTAALIAGAMIVLGVGAGALAYAVASDDDDAVAATSGPATTVTAPTAGATVAPPPTTGPLPPDTSATSPTSPATTPTAPGGTTTGFETVTGPTSTAPTTTQGTGTEPTTETEPSTGTGSSDWPAGRTAWTAVLASVRSESAARAAKARLASSGEPAGVLYSSDFPGMRPGYWVVFSGTYASRAQARSQAGALSARFPGAYARRIRG